MSLDIYIYVYNHSRRWQYKTNSDNIYVPPSCNLDAPRGGTTHIKHIMQVRFHRHIAAFLLAADCNVPQRPPAVIRIFTFIQMVHTHVHIYMIIYVISHEYVYIYIYRYLYITHIYIYIYQHVIHGYCWSIQLWMEGAVIGTMGIQIREPNEGMANPQSENPWKSTIKCRIFDCHVWVLEGNCNYQFVLWPSVVSSSSVEVLSSSHSISFRFCKMRPKLTPQPMPLLTAIVSLPCLFSDSWVEDDSDRMW